MNRSALLLLILLVTAVVLSVASYEYSTQVYANVANLSIDEIHSNTQIEANDLGHVLENNLESISSNLDVISNNPLVWTQDTTGATSLFDAAQNSTKDTHVFLFLVRPKWKASSLQPGNESSLSFRDWC